ncbi:MarR family winged helix-turn-helix transcriptional regulator [Aliiroseovarius sp.]|uniref:MarR family winged helix-turn-helix transcriptional regulator n=1 Tax=Aliiroseovarius sp. TaxID=1872442 RepID=UPI003BA843D7
MSKTAPQDPVILADQARATRSTSAGWMIQRLAGDLNRQMTTALAAHDLRLDQFAILMSLAETSGTTQTALAKRLNMQGYTVTRAVDALSDRGLVERLPDATSRRAWNVVLTDRGAALMPQLFKVVAQINADFLAALPDPAKERFLRLLTRLVAARGAGSEAEIGEGGT